MSNYAPAAEEQRSALNKVPKSENKNGLTARKKNSSSRDEQMFTIRHAASRESLQQLQRIP
jgi:hypothetical protein